MHLSDIATNLPARHPSLAILTGLVASAAPLLILVVPAAFQLPVIEPLLRESEFFPGYSRASLVAVPLAALVAVNAAIFAATRSLRAVFVASLITSTLACLLVLGAVGLVNDLNDTFGGMD